MNETLGSRIKALMDKLGISQPALAKMLGVKQASVWGWIKDKAKPKDIIGLAAALKTTPEWLKTGKGSAQASDLPERYNNHEFRKILAECYAVWKDGHTHIPAEIVLEIAEAIHDQIKGDTVEARRKSIKAALAVEERRASNSAP